MDRLLSEYLDLLHLSEDYLEGAVRRNRPGHPGFSGILHHPGHDGEAELAEIAGQIRRCTRCRLSKERKNSVPGAGVSAPAVMIIGEGPGAREDALGEPFVGAAGEYLDKWLEAIGLSRKEHVFITNLVKCRPPGNRDPLPDEIEACGSYLERQIELLGPPAILALGRIAAQVLSGLSDGIGRLRSGRHHYRDIPLFPTYHPSAVLRNPEFRKHVWEDLQQLRDFLAASKP